MAGIVRVGTTISARTTVTRTRYGYKTGLQCEGTQSEVESVAAALEAQNIGWQYTIDNSGTPNYSLTAYLPDSESGDASVSFRWDFPAEKIQRDIYEHPRSLLVDPRDIQTLKAWFKDPIENADPAFYVDEDPYGYRLGLYQYLQRGHDSYEWYSYRLIYTRNVGSRYSVETADIGVLQIWTIDQIIQEATTNGHPIPDRYIFKARAIPEQLALAPAEGAGAALVNNYKWGWLKGPTSETEMTNGRIEMTTEWILDLWSTYPYPVFNA